MADRPAPRPMDRFLKPGATPALPVGADAPAPLGFERHADTPALMIDFVLSGGDRSSFPYAYLSAIHLEAGGVLELEFSGRPVRITGRNLLPLYKALLVHLVTRVAVASSDFDDGSAQTWIRDIMIDGGPDTMAGSARH